jgi:hypothetical protein
MTTLIAVYNSRGCVGRCDARCYEAKSKTCHCICGGKNHSAGKSKSLQNNAERVGLTDDDLKRFAEATGRDPKDLRVIDRIKEPNARKARKKAKSALTEPELPFATERSA